MPDLLPGNNQKKIDASIYSAGQPNRKKSKLLWRSIIVLVVVIVLIGAGFLAKIVLAINSTNSDSQKKVSFFEQIKHLIINPEKQLDGEGSDRINILLAGIGGAGHDGAYLADTIIVVSIKPSTGEVATLSVPRDLYVDIPGYGWRKINNALAFGRESNYPGGGEALLASVVSKIISQPIDYYARVDFAGFRKIIDDIGGIDIYVDNSFADYEYPDYNYGYQTISFTKGWEHMSGERALQFVRSRHGTNGEGSDFARSKRQQKVLMALKDKLFSLNTFTNPSSIVSALSDLGNHNQTNLQLWEILRLAKLVQNIQKDQIITRVLDTGPDGLLINDTTPDGAYILRPKSGNFSEIQYLATNIFNTSRITRENAVIEVQNSTKETGLATRIADQLRGMQYNVVRVGNMQTQEPLARTTIYDLSGGKKPYSLASLKNMLNADVASQLPPFMSDNNINYQSIVAPSNATAKAATPDVDLLIIVGTDLASPNQLSRRLSPPL